MKKKQKTKATSKRETSTVLTLDGRVSLDRVNSKGKTISSDEIDGTLVLEVILHCLKHGMDLEPVRKAKSNFDANGTPVED